MLQPLSSLPMTATAVLTLDDLGLGQRSDLDRASRLLAERSEAQIARWVQFPAGALLFMLVPGDPESGAVYVFDRKTGIFYLIDFNDQKWGGHSLTEYETLERTCGLTLLAQQPWLLKRLCNPRKRA
jgi:hypothetical protein